MIRIDIERRGSQITGFTVSGHAQTAPHGYDIVCAGVSALTQSAVMGLERHLAQKISLTVESGLLVLHLIDLPNEKSDAILETMLLGLKEIANLNPRSVRITEHRR